MIGTGDGVGSGVGVGPIVGVGGTASSPPHAAINSAHVSAANPRLTDLNVEANIVNKYLLCWLNQTRKI